MSRAKNTLLLSVSSATAILLTLGAPSLAAAQDLRSALQPVALRSAVQHLAAPIDPVPRRLPVVSSTLKRARQSSPATKASIIALGALGGFVGGGYAGAAMENVTAPCHCDDPGLRGFMIGAPAGAIAGGVLAFHFTR